MDYVKRFCDTLVSIDSTKNNFQVFNDFCELSTNCLRQPYIRSKALEERFFEIIGNYTPKAQVSFKTLLKLTADALNDRTRDFLGECFKSLHLNQHLRNRHFTAYNVSRMLADICSNDIKDHIEQYCYYGFEDVSSDSGTLVIALSDIITKKGLSPAKTMFAVVSDVDCLCCYMTYIQMTLLEIPGVVIYDKEQWFTSGYYLNPWKARFIMEKTTTESSQLKYTIGNAEEIEFFL